MRRVVGSWTLCLLCFVMGIGGPLAAADKANWPGWLGPNRDGKSPDTGLLKQWPDGGPKLLWKVSDLGRGFSNVSVVDGIVYTTGDTSDNLVLFAFDLDGNLLWKTPIDAPWTRSHPGSRATPTIDEGNLYLLSGNGIIACCDAKTGESKWRRETKEFGGRPGGWGYAESVLIHGDLAIVKPGGQQCIVALNKRTGETVWTGSGFEAGPEYSSCIVANHRGGRRGRRAIVVVQRLVREQHGQLPDARVCRRLRFLGQWVRQGRRLLAAEEGRRKSDRRGSLDDSEYGLPPRRVHHQGRLHLRQPQRRLGMSQAGDGRTGLGRPRGRQRLGVLRRRHVVPVW